MKIIYPYQHYLGKKFTLGHCCSFTSYSLEVRYFLVWHVSCITVLFIVKVFLSIQIVLIIAMKERLEGETMRNEIEI